MKLGTLLKWGYFNKRRSFERVDQDVLEMRHFITDQGSGNLTKSPKYLRFVRSVSDEEKQKIHNFVARILTTTPLKSLPP